MTEPVQSTGESQPADDIRSALASAIASHEQQLETPKPESTSELKVETVETEAETEPVETEADGKDKERGPDGKFVKKEAEAGKEPDAAVVEPTADKKSDTVEPPVNWKAADKEAFKKLPSDAQKILVERQKDMDADYTRKTQAIAALKNEWEPVAKIFEPYHEVMKQKGFTPRSLIESWANVEKKLTENPVEVISGLVRGYRVNPNQLAAALGIKTVPLAEGEAPPAVEQPATFQLPPELLAELNQLKTAVGGLTQQQQKAQEAEVAAREARVYNEIEQFKEARDPNGNLLHPHFDEVEEDMTHLAIAIKAAGKAIPKIQDLYGSAVRANPSTYEKLRTAEMQHAEQKRKDEARAKAAAAKKAASSVTGAPGPGQATNSGARSDKSLREQLEEATVDAMSE